MAIILESAGPNPNHDPARRGYAVAVAVSNLDAAVAQSKAAAALLLAAAAEIRKLPAIDVVTERHGDSAPAQACHAAVSADIRDQLNRPVREALAELDAACRRWTPVILRDQEARMQDAFGAQLEVATLGGRIAALPVVVDATQGDALFAYLGSQPGTYQQRLAEYRAVRGSSLESIATANVGAARAIFLANRLTRGAAGYQGKAIGLDGGVIDVDFGVEVAAWNGAYIIIPAKDMGTGLEILKRYTTA